MRLDSIGESASDVAVGYWWHQDFWISGHAPEHLAIELDVLEIIAKAGPAAQLSAAEIASHITTKNAAAPIMLDRILRLLASYSILTCAHRTLHNGQLERLYGLAPVCKFLVRNEDGVSMAPLLCPPDTQHRSTLYMNLFTSQALLTPTGHRSRSKMASLLPSVKTSLPLATHLSPPFSRDLELQICTLRPSSVSPYSCLPLAVSLFNLAQSLSLSELSPSPSIPLSFDLNVPSFDLSISKPHDAAFKRLTTTTWRRVASFTSKVIGALPDYQRRGDPLYVLLCYWVAVVGAGLVKPEDILEGVAKNIFVWGVEGLCHAAPGASINLISFYVWGSPVVVFLGFSSWIWTLGAEELEEDRNAAAISANQAMTMIIWLQKEKTSMQMEALQYLRMMEEQAVYDQEALQKLYDLLTEKEKEVQDLEAKIEDYRKGISNELEGGKTDSSRREVGAVSHNSLRGGNHHDICSNIPCDHGKLIGYLEMAKGTN
ncbi:hypothetical protein ACLOJK_032098 [Asimina triloba]